MAENESSWDPSAYVSTVSDRANKSWGRSDEQYDWAKNQFDVNAETTKKVTDRALDTGSKFADWAETDRGDYERNVRPGMQEQMDFARGYTTPGRMAANRASAMAGSRLASSAAARNAKQNLTSFGVDPSSGRFAGLDAGLEAHAAGQAAGAGTKSDRDTEMMGQKLLDNAIGRGQVLPGQVAQGAATGMAADSLGVNAGLATAASGSATMGTPVQWEGMGNDMIKEWLKADMAKDASNQSWAKVKSTESSGKGAAIGAAGGIIGSIAGAYFGPIGSMIGGKIGSMAGSAIGGSMDENGGGGGGGGFGGGIMNFGGGGGGGGSAGAGGSFGAGMEGGMFMRRGGAVKRYAEGGPVEDDEDDQFEDEGDDSAYGDALDEDDAMGLTPEERQIFAQHWQSLAGGDGAPAYAEGGGVEEEETYDSMGDEFEGEGVTPEVMEGGMEGDNPNMVPPEASPSGGEDVDDVKAFVSVGEFVFPEDATRWYGEKYLQGLIEKARRDMQGAPAQAERADVPQAIAIAPPTFRSEGART